MKTIKDFTPEVQAKIPQYQERALKGVFDGGRYKAFNLKSAQEAVFYNYEKAGYKKPVVIVAGNPYESQVIINYIRKNPELTIAVYLLYCIQNNIECNGIKFDVNQLDNQLGNQLDNQLGNQLYNQLGNQLYNQLDNQLGNQLYNQLGNQLDNQLGNQLDNQLGNQLYNQLGNQLGNQLDNQLGNQLDNQLYNQLYNQLGNQLYNQLGNQLYNQLGNQLYNQLRKLNVERFNDYLFTLSVYSAYYFTWYQFISKEFGVDAKINDELEIFSTLYENSNIYSACFTKLVCVVSKFPKQVYRNSNNDLHNTKGYAVEWEYNTEETKFECYYVNGRYVEPELFKKIDSILFEEFYKIENEDQKGIVITAIKENKGNSGLMSFLGAVEVDKKKVKHTEDYSEVLTLYKTKKKFSFLQNSKGEMDQPYAWIHMVCPSTKTEYLIDTCPTFTDAVTCAKWHRPKNVPMELVYKWNSAN